MTIDSFLPPQYKKPLSSFSPPAHPHIIIHTKFSIERNSSHHKLLTKVSLTNQPTKATWPGNAAGATIPTPNLGTNASVGIAGAGVVAEVEEEKS